MKLDDLSAADICRGYLEADDGFTCICCGERFRQGEVYAADGRFFLAEPAVRNHLSQAHGDRLVQLIHSDSKYNTLTDNQKQLFERFAAGVADKEIARELEISTSTVRHQKFIFREKAKQARLYLAIYEGALGAKAATGGVMMPVHDHARMVDERYVVTEEERVHILQTAFLSLSPLRLKAFSPKGKKKIVILTRICEEFRRGQEYTEPEINGVLKEIHEDFATLRRALIEYGFMKRTRDGSKYWLT